MLSSHQPAPMRKLVNDWLDGYRGGRLSLPTALTMRLSACRMTRLRVLTVYATV